MKKIAGTLVVTTLFTIMAVFGLTAGAGEKGAAEMEVFGGSRGPVPFPHLAHQERLGDCQTCHSLFPQEADAIKALKASGKLKKKKVMNMQCVRCHKAEKKAGNPTGPTTCAKCHVRTKK